MRYKLVTLHLLIGVGLGCQFFEVVPRYPTEIVEPPPTVAPAPPAVEPAAPTTDAAQPTVVIVEDAGAAAPPPSPEAPPPTDTPAPPPAPTATPFFLQPVSMASESPRALPRHGLLIAFILPLLLLGIPGIILEIFIVRYVRPRGVDVSKVLIKAQDGLFVEASISMTARRTLTLASTRMSWATVQDFVEKAVEQELIHTATTFPTLDDLERNLKAISDSFIQLPIVEELARDFGVELLRFNIELIYPQETVDALKRKAEASAGGAAYLAYAAAAHLDPDSPECRELYRVFQETSGQVDAARNLGGGLSNLAGVFGQRNIKQEEAGDGSVE